MRQMLYLAAGCFALGLGALGIFLPLLPTVPFVILAAFCFARSSPALEAKLLNHRHFGPHISRWRDAGAISRKGKRAALGAFGVSAIAGFVLLPVPWSLVPVAVAIAGGAWIMSRPEAG